MSPDTATLVGLGSAALLPTGYLALHLAGYAWRSGQHRADRRHGPHPTGDELRREWDLDTPPPTDPAGHPLNPQVVKDLPARPAWDHNGDLIRDPDGPTASLRVVHTPTEDTDPLTGLPLPTDDYAGRHRPADPHADTIRIARYVGHRAPRQGRR